MAEMYQNPGISNTPWLIPIGGVQLGVPVATPIISLYILKDWLTEQEENLSDRMLRYLTEINLNLRIEGFLHAAAEHSREKPGPSTGPHIYGDNARKTLVLFNASHSSGLGGLIHGLGIEDLGHPFLDGISQYDFQEILKAVEKEEISYTRITAILNNDIPTPLVKITGLVDLVSLGQQEPPRLLKDRPRTFSKEAVDGLRIPREAKRHAASALPRVLRIDWLTNTEHQVRIVSTPDNERAVTRVLLDKDNPFIILTARDLHAQDWAVSVEKIPKTTPNNLPPSV